MEQKQFTFYDLYWDLIRQSDDGSAGRMVRNICQYMFTNEQVAESQDDRENFFWSNIVDLLEEDKRIELSGRQPKNLNSKMRHFTFLDTYYKAIKLMSEAESGQYVKAICGYIKGEECVYDKLGRPTIYRGNALAWHKYGPLAKYGDIATYQYNANGIRISKTVLKNENVNYLTGTTKFFLDGTKIVRSSVDNGPDIWYNYGVNGIQGITVNGTEYVFRKNVLGDVTHIYKLHNGVLTPAARYAYDAWGKCIVTNVGSETIGDINPIRYRGYYYDTETGLYYLNARYYDPETGRFISADSTQYLEPNTINGLNLYVYCGDNSVMNVDPSGQLFFTCLIIGLTAGAVIGATIGGKVAYDVAKESGATGWELFGWTVLGVVGGAVVGGAVGAVAGAAVGGLAAGVAAAGTAIGGAISGTGALAIAGGGVAAGGAAVAAGAISTGAAVAIGAAIGAIGSIVLMAKWIPESWPGDDPTVPPDEGFIWKGSGEPGSNKGTWYNPATGDTLFPDLNHPLPKGPHWDYWNKILKILKHAIFKSRG